MSRREEIVLAVLVFVGLALVSLTFLLACQQRGFDDSMCRAYGACGWRDA